MFAPMPPVRQEREPDPTVRLGTVPNHAHRQLELPGAGDARARPRNRTEGALPITPELPMLMSNRVGKT
jgi:hypothetical protein